MLDAKDLDNKVFENIDPWDEFLASTSWDIRASYNRTNQATPVQAIFERDIIFNLVSVVYWGVITVSKKWQLDIDDAQSNYRRVTHD